MCGVSGIIKWKYCSVNDEKKVEASLKKMQYRGPDYSGISKFGNAILGHNRLSIIDLNERSHQPMFSENKRYCIVFNGEIYNFKEIRNDLKEKGFTFFSESDTEVILNGFIQYGKDIVKQLNGMFAFVIWDDIEKKLFAARDRFGEKPFYFFNDTKNHFKFASNLAGIRELFSEDLKINKAAVFELFAKQYISSDSCIYHNIKKLPPASYLELDENSFKISTYWDLKYFPKKQVTFEKAKTDIHELLKNAVANQLEADVPVGLFLSGGTDSSVIAAIASTYKKDITALTMSTPNSHTDEAEAAAFVAKKLNINHEIIPLDSSCVSLLPDALKSIEPLADASLIPSLAIAKAAKKKYTVMLSGDGGDEIFGGYNVPLKYLNAPFKGNKWSTAAFNYSILNNNFIINELRKRLDDQRIFKWAGSETYFLSIFKNYSVIGEILNTSNYMPDIKSKYNEAISSIKNKEDVFLYYGVKERLVDDFLFKMDTANMCFSVESRAPFLDKDIIEYTSKMNLEVLLPNKIDKELLKEIGKEYLPGAFFDLPKKGFSIPLYEYMKDKWGNVLLKLIEENISSDLGIINARKVKQILNEYRLQPTFHIGKLLYSILVFEIWLRVFHNKTDDFNFEMYERE